MLSLRDDEAEANDEEEKNGSDLVEALTEAEEAKWEEVAETLSARQTVVQKKQYSTKKAALTSGLVSTAVGVFIVGALAFVVFQRRSAYESIPQGNAEDFPAAIYSNEAV